jgi:hypothetical protein
MSTKKSTIKSTADSPGSFPDLGVPLYKKVQTSFDEWNNTPSNEWNNTPSRMNTIENPDSVCDYFSESVPNVKKLFKVIYQRYHNSDYAALLYPYDFLIHAWVKFVAGLRSYLHANEYDETGFVAYYGDHVKGNMCLNIVYNGLLLIVFGLEQQDVQHIHCLDNGAINLSKFEWDTNFNPDIDDIINTSPIMFVMLYDQFLGDLGDLAAYAPHDASTNLKLRM